MKTAVGNDFQNARVSTGAAPALPDARPRERRTVHRLPRPIRPRPPKRLRRLTVRFTSPSPNLPLPRRLCAATGSGCCGPQS